MAAAPDFETDRWMDHDDKPRTRRQWLVTKIDHIMRKIPQQFLTFLRNSPGRISLVSSILVLTIIAAGGAMSMSSEKRQTQLDTLISRTEPLSFASQELYSALSDADTIATTSFIQKNTPVAGMQQYHDAIHRASTAIIKATTALDISQSHSVRLIVTIQSALPDYISLISQAHVNDRLHNPVAVSYLSQGSFLLQNTLLPAAQELYEQTNTDISHHHRHVTRPAWLSLSGMLAAIVVLIVAQLWLAAVTHRRINIGYCAATILMIIAFGWTAFASFETWTASNHTVVTRAHPFEELTQARIDVQKSRTSEALGIARRDYDSFHQEEFSHHIATIDTVLATMRSLVRSPMLIDEARENLRQWDTDHAHLLSQIRKGNYDILSLTQTSTTEHRHGLTISSLEEKLTDLISEARSDFRDFLIENYTRSVHTTRLVLLLTTVSILCVLLGTRPRLREFF